MAEAARVQEVADLDEEESVLRRKLTLFGTDVGQIPCFRNSFLYGILSGMGTGVTWFAFTSNIPRATNIGFYSYVAITFGYWCHCRWNYSKTKQEYEQIRYAMQMNSLLDGTAKGMPREKPKVAENVKDEPMVKS